MTDFLTRLETELRDAHGRRVARGPVRRAVDVAPRALMPAGVTVAALACGAVLAIALAGGGDAGAPAGNGVRPSRTLPASARSTPVAVLNVTKTPGLGRLLADRLGTAGADVVFVGDGPSQVQGPTLVLYAPGHRSAATAVADLLAGWSSPSPAPARTVIAPPGSMTVTPNTPGPVTIVPRTVTHPPTMAPPSSGSATTPARTAPALPPGATTPARTAPSPPPGGSATTPAAGVRTPLRQVLKTIAARPPATGTRVPVPALRPARPVLPMAIRIAPLDASTRVVAGSRAQVVVMAGTSAAAILGNHAITVPAPLPPATAYPRVAPAITRAGCPAGAPPLGRYGPREAGLAVREAWNAKDLPKVRSSVPAAASDRAAQVRHACGQTGVQRTVVVELDLAARHPSASMSQVVVFASRTAHGWRIWQRAH